MVLSLPKGHFNLARTGTDYSKINGKKHVAAKAIETKLPRVDIKKKEVIQRLKLLESGTPSDYLILAFWDKQTTKLINYNKQPLNLFPGFRAVPYYSEACIAQLVMRAVGDAINILRECDPKRYDESLSVRMEMQLFSYKPDILVVRYRRSPIFAVEVKKPLLSETDTLARHESVLGQSFDYLTLLEALGYINSFVVTTCITQSFACWTNKEEEESPASSPDDRQGQVILSATTQGQSSATEQPAKADMQSPPVAKVRSTADNKTAVSASPPTFKTPPLPMQLPMQLPMRRNISDERTVFTKDCLNRLITVALHFSLV
jgi:hypothetical protein